MIDTSEITLKPIHSRGKGGQNVNKVATGIHLRFDIKASSLSEEIKLKLLKLTDGRLSKDGVIIIKADSFRTQEKNRLDALKRLHLLIENALKVVKIRKPTKASKAIINRRIEQKSQHSKAKQLRKKVQF